jgi:site-specific DNA recombinase
LEEFVVEQLRTVGTDPALLDATLSADRADRAERRPEIEAKVRRLTAQRGKAESERRNLVDAIAGGTGDAPHALIDRVAELDRSIEDVEKEAAQARSELAALELGTINADELRSALADLEPIWVELFPRERARVLALLLERVEFHGTAGDVVLAFRPGAPRGVTR